MSVLQIVGGALQLQASNIIIFLVMLQESKDRGLSGLTGGSTESYLDTNGNRTRDAQLSRFTKFVAIAFFVLCIAINVVAVFVK